MPPLRLYPEMGARLTFWVAEMTIRPMFAWYDFWVGVFLDRQKSRLYIFPVPMFGIVIEWR